ncbi:type II secretion system F family protein [Candidatus Woesearchaeota archaeon]|nr:type II secretion system F family protein [Candidatus Woesearchaeota archaeon]
MIKITEESEAFANKLFPNLKEDLRMAQMKTDVGAFVNKCLLMSLVFAFNLSLIFVIILIQRKLYLLTIPVFVFFFIIMFTICIKIPKFNIAKVRQEIESDIFTPSRMMLTLLESGNSLISALENVSYTKAKSSKYFGKIASEIYLGKNIEQAIEDAIKYTPSDSFRMVLEPIKKSLKTGTDIQVNLQATLQQLSEQKIVEIEQYEKRLNPLSMFYMIFGTVLPAIGVVGMVLILSVIGFKIEFFPVFLILLILIIILQLFFVKIFQSTRPMVKL